jgi:Sigma-70, region 4
VVLEIQRCTGLFAFPAKRRSDANDRRDEGNKDRAQVLRGMRSAATADRGQRAGLLRQLLEGAARDGRNAPQGSEAGMSHLAARPAQELSAYHDRTIALLRRYFRMSLEIGRMPSILGREVFRARVTSYRVHTFEDAVIFVHDVERCLERLEPFSRQLIARVILQDYSYEEAAALLGCGERSVYRLLPLALNHLSEIFLSARLLSGLRCQEGEAQRIPVTP